MAPLTPEQLAFYNSEGYLVIEGFASLDECKQMMCRMEELVHGLDPSNVLLNSADNNYLCESASNISFFFEEGAFDEQGHLKRSKELSLEKVGHALHEQDPEFKKYSESSRVADVLMSLNYKKPVLIQSMYIFKQPGTPADDVPHQDNSYLYSNPPSLVGLWLALEDATLENGCLLVLPKSHKDGTKRRYIKESNITRFVGDSPKYDNADFVALEVKAGSLVILHGDNVHQSLENKTPKSRHAYAIHAFDLNGCSWAPDNWLQRKEFPRPLYGQ